MADGRWEGEKRTERGVRRGGSRAQNSSHGAPDLWLPRQVSLSQDLENLRTASANPLRPSCLRPSGCSPYIVSIILVAPTRGSFFHTYDRAPNTHQEGDAAPNLSTNSCSSLAAVSDMSLLAHLFVVFPTACRQKTETEDVTMRRPSCRVAFRWSVRSTYFFPAAARVCTENSMCV